MLNVISMISGSGGGREGGKEGREERELEKGGRNGWIGGRMEGGNQLTVPLLS